MNPVFHFKYFDIRQEVNSHKLGSDSLVLGAWTNIRADRILDVGTGTGVLALMMAQNNPEAHITAIEPIPQFLAEANTNFHNSPYSDRILSIQTELQSFGAMEKFDLIITNPPYFNSTFQSPNDLRNSTRHDAGLEPFELFECCAELLSETGKLSLIIPFEREEEYLYSAHRENLHPSSILRTLKPSSGYKRTLIQFGFERVSPMEEELLIKDAENKYSAEYIELTKEFHGVDLK